MNTDNLEITTEILKEKALLYPKVYIHFSKMRIWFASIVGCVDTSSGETIYFSRLHYRSLVVTDSTNLELMTDLINSGYKGHMKDCETSSRYGKFGGTEDIKLTETELDLLTLNG